MNARRNFIRIDIDIVKEIFRTREKLFSKNKDEQDVMFFVYMHFNAMRKEHCWASYWHWMPKDRLPTKEEWAYWLGVYSRDITKFNHNPNSRYPDDMVIVTPVMVLNDEGLQGRMFCQKMGYGARAEKEARRAEKFIKGWIDRREKLDYLANDMGVQRRHESRYKRLKKLI